MSARMFARVPVAAPSFAVAAAPASAPVLAANSDRLRERTRLSHVGRYQLNAPLGEGLHGGVYEGWDPLLARAVAIKTLQFGLKMASRIAVDRHLLYAARAAADLSHRGIVSVYDTGLSAHGVYIAMERLKGQDLRRTLAEGWEPPLGEALRLARRMADALAYAHARGVFHGGLEPGSIFLTPNNRPKLMNFGLVGALRDAEVPELGDIHLDTLAYRAPEQLAGNRADARSDIYSLGAVLYELLSGRQAFLDDAPEPLLQAMLRGPATPLRRLRPDLPGAVVNLVEAAMAFEPQARPQTATSVAAALRSLAHAEGPLPPAIAPRLLPAPSQAKRHWTSRWAFAGGMLGLGGLGIFSTAPGNTRPLCTDSGFAATAARPQVEPGGAG